MFTVICPDGDGVNLENFDYWYVRKQQGKHTYGVYSVRIYEIESDEPYDVSVFYHCMTRYETERDADNALTAMNNSILANERGHRLSIIGVSNSSGDQE